MSGPKSPYVRLFRCEGYPPLEVEIDAALERAWRLIESSEDPVKTALDLAAALEIATHVVRDFAADLIIGQAS